MPDHEVLELVRLKRAADEPERQLRMPDEGVASHLLSVGFGEGDERIGRIPVEHSAQRLDEAPFHLVLRRDAGELSRRQPSTGLLAEIAPARSRRGPEGGVGRCARADKARGGRQQRRRRKALPYSERSHPRHPAFAAFNRQGHAFEGALQ